MLILKGFLVALLGVLAIPALSVAADPVPQLPPGGQSLLPSDTLKPGQFKLVDIQNQPFPTAIEVEVANPPELPWLLQFSEDLTGAIKRGDVCHVRFFARNIHSMTGTAALGVVVEQNHEPWDKAAEQNFTVGSEWQAVDLPFIARRDFPAGGAHFCIRLGYAQQKLQFAGLQVLNYGNQVKYTDLPRINATYAGRELSAPWRSEAQARIEKIRKADLAVLVRDAAGNPVPNAQVHAVQTKHAFGFGTAISDKLLAKDKDAEIYRQKVKELFSTCVLENELKWGNILWRRYTVSEPMVAWLRANGLTVRGHNLVWPGPEFLPKQILALQNDPDKLRQTIADHITETASHFKGQLIDWDVINEPYANHLVMDKLGNQVMVDWFKLARAADPTCKLYLNDYEILASGNQLDTPHQRGYYNTLKYLIDQGAPIDGIGMQGHFGASLTAPENLMKILDRYAALGLRIKVTELDMKLDDEQLRADYMRDFLTVLFSHPAVDGVVQWGFWEGAHWIPESALFARDWTLRSHGQVFVDLTQKQWHTDTTGSSDNQGAFRFRGFKGDYQLTASANGKTATATTQLNQNGEVVLTLK
jgi:endo-1,4-beta-xylanase